MRSYGTVAGRRKRQKKSFPVGANCFPITALLNPYTFHCGFFSHTLKQKSAVHPLTQKTDNFGQTKHQYFYSKESFVLKKN